MTLPAVVIAAVLAVATSVNVPVSTNVPAAQAATNRGLFLYYAYNRGAATRAFQEAAERDPNLAMADWGIALAEGPDLNTPLTADRFTAAQSAIRHGLAMEGSASAKERRYVEIMASRYAGGFSDWQRDDAAYRSAMLAFAQSSNDENARLLAAEALLEHGGLTWQNSTPASPESREALALVTAALHDDPSDPMANHLCLHLYDLAPDRRPALPCAKRLDATTFSSEAEHLAHMPAHYWIETGDYAAAVASSERAVALMQQLETSSQDAEHVHQYYEHDVVVGYSAAMMLGNYATALRWAQRMQSAYGSSFDALTALRFGRYADAYTAPDAAFGNPSVRGLAALHIGKPNEASAIVPRAKNAATRGYIPQLFLARTAELDGKIADAQRWVAQAAADENATFSGELIPLFPAGEALGFLDLRRAQNSDAIAAFTQTLATYPNDPRALYGLAAALTADGQSAAAAQARSRFAKMWEGADTSLSGADLP